MYVCQSYSSASLKFTAGVTTKFTTVCFKTLHHKIAQIHCIMEDIYK